MTTALLEQIDALISLFDENSGVIRKIEIIDSKMISTQITEGFRFGHVFIQKAAIVAHTSLSYASVNLKPITNGHLLIMPKRAVSAVKQLSREELGDLWYLAQQMSVVLERKYGSQSTTFAIQDGKYAGQTVDHVHIHVIPRFPKDFKKNDDIYVELEKEAASDVADGDRKTQTMEEMEAEALSYRKVVEAMD